MVKPDSILPMLGSWGRLFSPFLSTPEFQDIYKQLKEKGRTGIEIFPLSHNVYKAFELCPYDKLKAIIIGMCPYHTKKDNVVIADGMAFSASITKHLPPSLEQFYQGMEYNLWDGLNLNMIKDPDLSYLAKQGVLLLNAGLTVEKGKPGSHNELWKPFMEYLFKEILNNYNTGLPIAALGKQAQEIAKDISSNHYILHVEHPAASTYEHRRWKHNDVFTWINGIINKNNGKEEEVMWDLECPF